MLSKMRRLAVKRTLLAATAALSSPVWLAALATTPAHAGTLEEVTTAGVIHIAVPQDYPPFGSVGTDMQLQGFDIEVAKLIAAAMHVKVQLVPVTMANKIAYLQTNKADLVLNLGNNPERAKVVSFTQAYAPYYIGIFGPNNVALGDVAALAGKSIGVVSSSLEDMLLTRQAPPNAEVRRYQDNNSAVAAFLSGQVQFLATGNIVGAALLAKNPDRHLEQKLQLMNSPVCSAVRKNDTAMLARVNEIISALKKSGQLETLSRTWLKQPLDMS